MNPESNNKRPSRCLSRLVRRCEIYNEINGTEYTPETYDAERTRVPRMIEWDQGWEACESAPACSAVEVKNWTASDAKDSLMMMDQSGRRFHVTGIGWDGTVGVVAYDAIKPEDRDGWRLFVIQQND